MARNGYQYSLEWLRRYSFLAGEFQFDIKLRHRTVVTTGLVCCELWVE
jgi:hypothetical protein